MIYAMGMGIVRVPPRLGQRYQSPFIHQSLMQLVYRNDSVNGNAAAMSISTNRLKLEKG